MASLLVRAKGTIARKFIVTGNTSDISWCYMFVLFVCLKVPNAGQYIFTHVTLIINYMYLAVLKTDFYTFSSAKLAIVSLSICIIFLSPLPHCKMVLNVRIEIWHLKILHSFNLSHLDPFNMSTSALSQVFLLGI